MYESKIYVHELKVQSAIVTASVSSSSSSSLLVHEEISCWTHWSRRAAGFITARHPFTFSDGFSNNLVRDEGKKCEDQSSSLQSVINNQIADPNQYDQSVHWFLKPAAQ